MIDIARIAAVLVIAYLLGSIPTALIISKKINGVDIRLVGDGNMGARNTFHEIGPKFGIMVAVIDFCKGALPVFLAYIIGLDLAWQMLTAVLAILGHDFPLFAGFKGGQGTATSLGTMLPLFPIPTLIGLAIFGTVYLVTKKSVVSLGIGGGVTTLIVGFSQQWLLFGYAIIVFLFIPVKLLIDSPRRRTIATAKHTDFA
jgi:glycerol-3-phosphate acyltransferase PlsY